MHSFEIRNTVWLNFAAGDGCFIIGLGGKNAVPKPVYEPYQCCPTKVKKGTKVAKATPTSSGKKEEPPKKKAKGENPGGGGTSKYSSSNNDNVKSKDTKGYGKDNKDKAISSPSKEKSSKGKKGFFGSGKYIWWW